MDLFDVYPLYEVTLTHGKGSKVYDENGLEYLDLYGGHGVISIGHGHPAYVDAITKQVEKLGFYSNSVKNPLQEELAARLGTASQSESFQLFLCNSGAEANENALKLASFHTGHHRIVAFEEGFHGRTSAAVSVTDNDKIKAPLNLQHEVVLLPLNRIDLVENELKKEDVAAVIIEGIQGVGGLEEGSSEFFRSLEALCRKYGTVLILDEIQSGYGRTGTFFAFQHHGISPDLITVAKGMGNGFPVAGLLISPEIQPSYGLLGTTFGGNHLACSAALSVLSVLDEESLVRQAAETGAYARNLLAELPGILAVKGRGLMLGVELGTSVSELRKKLIFEKHIFTGGSKNPNLLRILPPLNISKEEIKEFTIALHEVMQVAADEQ